MGKMQSLNDIAKGRFPKKSSMSLSLKGIIREEALEEDLVDARADDIIRQLNAENIRGLVCDIARFLESTYIDWAVKMSLQPGIRCPAARFNSLCYKHLVKSPLYIGTKKKRQFYNSRRFATAA